MKKIIYSLLFVITAVCAACDEELPKASFDLYELKTLTATAGDMNVALSWEAYPDARPDEYLISWTSGSSGAEAIIFSLEMSKEQLGQRLLAMQARVEMQKLKQGDLDRKDWDRVSLGVDELNNSKIVIDDTPGISLMEMRNKCRRLKAEQGLDLIVVDYLQLMTFEGRTDNRQQEISALSRNMKLLAREMNCPVILLSQLSRAPELRQDKRPMLSDLRESGSIEQDADIVIFLYRDDYYNENTEKPGVCEVNIAKHRSGPTDKIELTWVARYTKFSDKAL